jgi:major membrane immunogen (membrane-anchored lipoprotein)
MNTTVRLAFVLAASVLLYGCSSSEVVRAPVEATIGQQLMDLKRAFDNGALSQREYDDQRRRLIRNAEWEDTMRTYQCIAIAGMSLVLLAGCVSASSSNLTLQQGVKFSKGRELDDLVKAREARAVTAEEYEELRQIIMKRPNWAAFNEDVSA